MLNNKSVLGRLLELALRPSLDSRIPAFTKDEILQQLCENRALPRRGGIIPVQFANLPFLLRLYGNGVYVPSSDINGGKEGVGYKVSLIKEPIGIYHWNVEVELTRWD